MKLQLTPPKFIRSNFTQRRRKSSPKKAFLSSEETEKLAGLNKLFGSPKSLKKRIVFPSEETEKLEGLPKLFDSKNKMGGSKKRRGQRGQRGQRGRRTRKH